MNIFRKIYYKYIASNNTVYNKILDILSHESGGYNKDIGFLLNNLHPRFYDFSTTEKDFVSNFPFSKILEENYKNILEEYLSNTSSINVFAVAVLCNNYKHFNEYPTLGGENLSAIIDKFSLNKGLEVIRAGKILIDLDMYYILKSEINNQQDLKNVVKLICSQIKEYAFYDDDYSGNLHYVDQYLSYVEDLRIDNMHDKEISKYIKDCYNDALRRPIISEEISDNIEESADNTLAELQSVVIDQSNNDQLDYYI